MSSYDDRPTALGTSHSPAYSYGDDGTDMYSDTAELEREQPTEVAEKPAWTLGWNSGADLGLLLMRLVVGGIFFAHGGQKVFGWFGGPGLDGFANFLQDNGFQQADILSALTGYTELVGGVMVVLGLFTPLAAAGLLGVAINVIWLKWFNGLFITEGGFELELALAGLAAGLTLAGPGRVAFDNGRIWFRHPVVTGWFFLLVGAAAAVAVRLVFHG